MNLPANPKVAHHNFLLEVISGNDKGVKFQIVANKATIGRAKDNDIVLNDQKISRKHAVLYVTPEGLQITRVKEQSKILVGKQDVANAILELPSVITLGKTKIKIIEQSLMPESRPIHNLNMPAQQQVSYSSSTGHLSSVMHNTLNKSPSKMRFYVIIGIVGVLFYVMLSDSEKEEGEEEEEKALVTTEEQEEQISSIQEQSNELIRTQQQTGRNSTEYREARAFFIQGLRDYREGNYLRAMDYFNGALALFPNHALSQRYLNQARTKHDELIQMTLLNANSHYERKQYRQARAGYKQLLRLIRDKNNTAYREAKERFEECSLRLQTYF